MCVCACECMYQFHKKGNFFKRTLFIVWLFFFSSSPYYTNIKTTEPPFFILIKKQLKKCWGRGSIISPTCQLNGITHLINSSSYMSFYSPIWHLHRGVKILKRINKKIHLNDDCMVHISPHMADRACWLFKWYPGKIMKHFGPTRLPPNTVWSHLSSEYKSYYSCCFV